MVQPHRSGVVAMALEVRAESFVFLVDGVLANVRKTEETEHPGENGKSRSDPKGILARGNAVAAVLLDDLQSVSIELSFAWR